ncbi:unnamed protein product [Orchesella dallaii]|uniref:Ammonium transporter n=1 Tax=Orchesella dallaii TaxID=48710 RepID=A0ABP1S3H2_9HEXA
MRMSASLNPGLPLGQEDVETVTILNSDTVNSQFTNHSSYHHYPTAREYEPAGLTFLMMTSAITWIMLPGVGFFYSGMARSKSALSLLMLCLWSAAIVSIQWYLIGFTLCLSNTGGKLIGNLDHLLMREIGDRPSFTHDQVPLLLASVWYSLFAAITPTVFLGAIAERARFFPTVIFIFLWSTFVFDFLCYWTWNKNGWSFLLGSLDFGGGTPVHLSSGAAALAFSYMVGKREDTSEKPPQNMSNVYLGTSFIWCGWLVANAGSGLYPHIRAVNVFVTTNLAASMGGITWGIIDYIRHGQKWSPLGFCAGVICGLVCITPASGYVTPSSSLFFGFAGAICCNFAMSSKKLLHVDDAFDVFSCHGVGAIVGNLLTGVFAQRKVAAVDGQHIQGGWLDGHWAQIGYQAVDTAAGFAWSFFVTLLILFFINKFPGLHLRASPEDQEVGLDKVELGVGLYEHLNDLKPEIVSAIGTKTIHPNVIAISTIAENGHGPQHIIKNGHNGFIVDSGGGKEMADVETSDHI